jgi:lipoprotein NlpD
MNVLKNEFKNMPSNIKSTQKILHRLCMVALLAALAGCAARNPAPVSDARPPADARGAVTVPPTSMPPLATATGLPSTGMPSAKPLDPSKIHVIQTGDTMFSIARKYGLDYRELAAWNNIVNPTSIRLGDTLRLTRPDLSSPASSTPIVGATDPASQVTPNTNSTTPLTAGEVITTPLMVTPPIVIEKPLINSPAMKVEPKASKLAYTDQAYAKLQAESGGTAATPALPNTALPTSPATASATSTLLTPSVTPPPVMTPPASAAVPATTAGDMPNWAWPVKGKVLTTFTETTKGIDIAGTRGKPVLAAAAGKVIYNEAGLRGYGRMIIIKHNEQWLTAYAHNEKILVQKDQEIKQGQKIAEMGSSDTDAVKLHFEIRKQGKPVDPMKYLPAQ